MLGNEPGHSGRAASVPDHWAISPDTGHDMSYVENLLLKIEML